MTHRAVYLVLYMVFGDEKFTFKVNLAITFSPDFQIPYDNHFKKVFLNRVAHSSMWFIVSGYFGSNNLYLSHFEH